MALPYQTMGAGRLAAILAGLALLLVLSAAAFAGLLNAGTVPGWAGLLALAAHAALLLRR